MSQKAEAEVWVGVSRLLEVGWILLGEEMKRCWYLCAYLAEQRSSIRVPA